MRVHYFTCAKWALDDIENERLKVCRFSALNDPFELFAGHMRGRPQRRQMRMWAADIDKRYGLLCFSKDWHDPLMWSHYGDRHRGICLGFDVDAKILREIKYEPERLLLASSGKTEIENLLLTTKFARWRYERERRMIVPLDETTPEGEHYFRKFDRNLNLASVIVGPRCATTKENIAAALGHRAIQARIIKGTSRSTKRSQVGTDELRV